MRSEDARGTVPIDSLPDPVAGYGFPDGQAVIAESNDAFDAAYDASVGTTVQHWLRAEVGVDERMAEDICATLVDSGEVDVKLGDRSAPNQNGVVTDWYVHTLDAADGPDDVDGYMLLSERPEEGVEIDRIASVISHDLRNPLDVAKAHLRAARETGEQEHFDNLRESHERMEQIIRDVLTLARGKNALNVNSDVDIADVAADAWGTVDTEAASLTLEEDLPRIRADPDRLQRLFENLFRNSVEHGSTDSLAEAGDAVEHGSTSPDWSADQDTEIDAGSEVSVADASDDGVEQSRTVGRPEDDDSGEHPQPKDTETEGTDDRENDDAGDPLCLRVGSMQDGFFVADDGVGIPPEERTQVFDPGYSSSGTGLGLTIVRQIAEAHDWSISLTTGDEGGARFEFQFRSGEGSV